jgi:hypothetical protein
MPVDFTPEEKGVLSRLFPGELLSKLVTTIRDAILTSEKFAAAVTATAAKVIFGVEEPKGIPGAIVGMVDEAVRRHQPGAMSEQEFLERLKAALGRPEVVEVLGPIVLELRRAEVREADAGRTSAIREQIGVRYGADNIPEPLVRLVRDKLVLRGHPDGWPAKIASFLEKLEEQATETIRSLLLKKYEGEDVAAFGRFVVLSGVDPENPQAVHELLADREGIGEKLKRRAR